MLMMPEMRRWQRQNLSLLLSQHGLFGKFQVSESPRIQNQSTNKTEASKVREIDSAKIVDLTS